MPTYALDLDGTFAEYIGFQGPTIIGDPIPLMLERVKGWLDDGIEVVIFSARANTPAAVRAIRAWTKLHLGIELEATNIKHPRFTRIYDDRAVAVETNTGRIIGGGGEKPTPPRLGQRRA